MAKNEEGKKRWFVMSDLTVNDFNVYEGCRIGDVTGLSDYIIPHPKNKFSTKKAATEAASKIKHIFLLHSNKNSNN